jgi:transposase
MSREEVVDYAIRKTMELESLLRQIYGTKSERFVPIDIANQLKLELGQIGEPQEPPVLETITYDRKKPKKKQEHPGRHPLPGHLPRKEIVIEPEEDTSEMTRIGEEVTETLDYTPPKFIVNRYIRPKYARPQTDEVLEQELSGVLIAPMPSRPIDKGIAEAGLLASILIDKYADHMPLYRQIQRFKRVGINISDSTIGTWVAQVCKLMEPLYEAHRREVLTQSYLMADETTIKVLDRQKKTNKHLGYYWVYYAPTKRLVLFDYQPTRTKAEPVKCLKNFQGYLQTDGYAGYDQFKNTKGIVMLNCMAHARRKFFEAGEKLPDVIHAMGVFRKLYAIEAQAREYNLTHDQRQAIRMEEAKPIWEEFQNWMLQAHLRHTPKSKIREAVDYTLPRWVELGRYILNGELEIDNNLIENQIRPVAIGRKNYLFAGSHAGAQKAAMVYSMLGTCKMHGIEPYAWLKNVLEKLPDYPVNRVEELLPQNWKGDG